jgi:ribosome maturation factor RimP
MVLRSERTGIEKNFYDLCVEVVTEAGLELYDMDYIPGSSTLRLFIQNSTTGTAVIEECARVDRALSPYIDEADWMPETLTLEVSSPGLFRPLVDLEHFKSANGESIQLTLKKKLSSNELPKKIRGSKKLLGVLKEVHEDRVDLKLSDELTLTFMFEDIAKANLETQI